MIGIKLILPVKKLEKEFKDIIFDYQLEGDLLYYSYMDAINNFDDYLRRLKELSVGKNLPQDDVPVTEYWLVDIDEKEIRGMIKIRYKSIPIHGNISYNIPPKKRFLGYGTNILQLGIEKAKELGIEEVKVSCASNNEGSRKIILKNNAVFIGLKEENNEVYEVYIIK
ncbi:MAG: GNAT family N-acetyltransferase [Psychrilyobacter sp.]|uniref:GNAT family N-acetyltransferase n=1 Tax=Psychrilyobacter sp. TaxID=2586924 RepID=UPI003C78F9AB